MTQQEQYCVLTDEQKEALFWDESLRENGDIDFNRFIEAVIKANDEARRKACWLIEPPRPIEEAPKDGTCILIPLPCDEEDTYDITKWEETQCDECKNIEYSGWDIGGLYLESSSHYYNLPPNHGTDLRKAAK